MPNILFATNRQPLANDANGLVNFGDQPQPANAGSLLCATATVDNVTILQPSSGTISAISPLNQGGFAERDLAPIIDSTRDVLVFVHGAANSFRDAITRAAYNQTWLAAAGLAAVNSDFDVIAFTWPARPYNLADIVGDLHDYRHDQEMARASAFHFGLVMRLLTALRQRLGNRRLNLLCHSMGNYVLGGGVELLFANSTAPTVPLFDEIVLAAADEVATTFSTVNDGRLADLWRLGREITVYYNNDDVAMHLSHLVNQNFRLGHDGPPNKADTHFFSTNVYEFVDCTGIDDFISTLSAAPDRSHQYYRQSSTVRADIATSLAGAPATRAKFDKTANVYSLFP